MSSHGTWFTLEQYEDLSVHFRLYNSRCQGLTQGKINLLQPNNGKACDARRITAAELKYMIRTAGYIWTDYKTNEQIAKKLKITPNLDKLLEYKGSWIQHINRMPRNRLPRVMKYYSATGRRNHGRPLKILLDT